ncbi:MAG: Acetyl-coenzyme synthetase [Frankiales bacterium]|nr:Acetyl-coenzyme synthetase [Frankiales bacterium]
MTTTQAGIEGFATEDRRFDPPAELAASANVREDAYATAAADRLSFWEEQARRLQWAQPWDTALDWQPPFAKWFVGGKLNVAVNCLDRHVDAGNGDRIALHWVGEPEDDTRDLTYRELLRQVSRTAHALTELGVQAGDRVCIYLPMVPEAVISMLACARIGAAHSVVFGGFSAQALVDRITDADAKVVITADGGYRRGAASALKPAVDEAVKRCPSVTAVVVVKRTGQDVDWVEGRDHWWADVVDRQPQSHQAEAFDAEQPLFLLYTSGTTGKPKGILHTSGGYLVQTAYTHWAVFDLKPETDVYWCTADVGWVTGHSYLTYGPLANGCTQVMYEGTPDAGGRDRWWKIIETYGVTILYTAPTAIRTFMKWGEELPGAHDLSSLRVLGSVGEPINPEAWMWYRRVIGGDRCPIVDTWWQTETGAMMIAPLPGVSSCKPGSAMGPLPGISLDVVDGEGTSVGEVGGGFLTLDEPWPAMLRGIWGDEQRYRDTYWSRFEGRYFAGDGAKWDSDHVLWLLGRVDDVMNVSGHRISTTEVESALVSHPSVAEAAVVGATDPTTGQAIVAFVTVKGSVADDISSGEAFAQELRDHVATQIGPIAKPKQIHITPELPKTRSGKIMRRLLKDVAENRELGDVTTLADPTVVNAISARASSQPAGGSPQD